MRLLLARTRPAARREPLDYARMPWMKGLFAATGIFLYFPIVTLIVFSFNDSRRAIVWEGFTLRHYLRAADNASLQEAFLNSLIVASTSTVVATVLGTMLGLALHRYRFPGRGAFDAWLHLPIVVPEVCMGVALLAFFALLDVSLGLVTIILSHVAFSIPFVAVLIRARMVGFDPALEEAARDLGAGPWRIGRTIVLPYLGPAIAASALLAFTLSIDDFVITFFTSGPGSTTLPLKIYSMVRFSVTPEVNAASTVLIVIAVAFVIGAMAIQSRARRSEAP
ncbi:MAG: ABC transporter permease [Alphaproteobacteria bacterium]